jgi:hypothetical protein
MPRETDPKYQVSWKEEIKANLRGVALVAQASPLFLTLLLLRTGLQGVLPGVIVFRSGVFIGQVTRAVSAGPGSAVQAAACRTGSRPSAWRI